MILVCGEALMDVFALASTATGMALEARVGGSPFNVAVGLARLEKEVAFFGAISRDFMGQRLLRALREEGVDASMIERVDAPTTLGVVGLDELGVPSYAFYGDSDRRLEAGALRLVTRRPAALHVGSFACVVEPVASTLRALVEREREHALIAYDPNVRLNVEPDRARWRAGLDWMLTRAHLLKISEEDLDLLCPGMPAEDFIASALDSGAGLVVVTRGASGAFAGTRSVRVAVPALVVPVADTVGAGDSFQAALLAWLSEQGALAADSLEGLAEPRLADALRFASRAASITCSRRGADLPKRTDLCQP